ncbi:MAG: acetyl-CoA carboxylase biotin carboxyl carrier protein [Alphaproteobacteria bacterium]|nr:acetyl-CoA carboxylase biotin carboxyl carrier protein [Alphaproteobacteria bacterium]
MGKLSIDPDVIRELAALLDETNLTEIEWEEDDQRVRVSRGGGGGTHIVAAPSHAAPAAPGPVSDPAPATDDPSLHPGAVKSPMVGTAYLAPEPAAPAFVSVGDRVSLGQTLLIVEAMKTMNPIAAPRAGTVTKILIDDSTPVEFGEPLMIVE